MKRLVFLSLILIGCQNPKSTENVDDQTQKDIVPEVPEPRHPEWVKSANIYEVNIRQYSKEGTIAEFAKHLPRLSEMGVDILWIMPVQPIGVLNRKMSESDLGSYYSIRNYKEVNPDLGTMDDFKAMVDQAHDLGMKVILDWVANHTAWDHHWVNEHPEWYTQDSLGNSPITPIDNEGNPTDWTDVADLNYENAEMRVEMFQDMKFWLDETGIDGFRCDVAGFVPFDFWEETNEKLRSINPDIFMLAEWEDPELTKHFNMDYGWHLHHIMNQIAKGEADTNALANYLEEMRGKYADDDMRMFFTTNHDENSWNGTVYERMGEAHKTFFVLAATFDQGMPLIYSGQEAGLNHRLSFFGKDEIDWSNLELSEFYKNSLKLKHDNPALWNAGFGGELVFLETGNDDLVAYSRAKDDSEVIVVLNFTDKEQALGAELLNSETKYVNWYSKNELIESTTGMNVLAHEYYVWVKK